MLTPKHILSEDHLLVLDIGMHIPNSQLHTNFNSLPFFKFHVASYPLNKCMSLFTHSLLLLYALVTPVPLSTKALKMPGEIPSNILLENQSTL